VKTGLIIMFRRHQQPTHGKICRNHRKARLDWELAGAPPASRSRVSICQPWHVWRSGGLLEDLGWVFQYWVVHGYDMRRPSSKGYQLQYESWALGRKMHQGMWSAGQLFDMQRAPSFAMFRLYSSGFHGLLLRGPMCPLN
jgi:hypothetical protein